MNEAEKNYIYEENYKEIILSFVRKNDRLPQSHEIQLPEGLSIFTLISDLFREGRLKINDLGNDFVDETEREEYRKSHGLRKYIVR